MRRLYLHIYLTFLGILVVFAVLAAIAWWSTHDERDATHLLEGIGGVLGEVLPPPRAPAEDVQAVLDRLGKRFKANITLRTPDGRMIGSVGRPLPAPPPGRRHSGWMKAPGRGPVFAIALPDQRWAIVRPERPGPGNRAIGFIAIIVLLLTAIGIGAYPMTRRLTGRLERLQSHVDHIGNGDLAARVEVEGKDEIAALARSFNRATERIQRLMMAQKEMLASASHELRSPLTRIRMAVELLAGDDREELRERVARDIADLDDLIEELLMASRLDRVDELQMRDDVDLLALAVEEAARVDAEVSGDSTVVNGDPRLLRRLLRNLLENARRYGNGSPIDVEVTARADGAVIRVLDRGPGIPADEHERIFQPFYRRPGMREGIDKGVGLGLALVRQIAHRHGGDVVCRDREGGGTCFEVTLRETPD
ncbi:MAG: sensor histidine kinase [Proteobacteria bacterium]|nr:MAG: sensor histidine kinase [Pseudomonadota bacterium]QKK11546.1 MAG: HAMP domain-containing histidine kinase [Pseudomonadota bacterium]